MHKTTFLYSKTWQNTLFRVELKRSMTNSLELEYVDIWTQLGSISPLRNTQLFIESIKKNYG